MSKSRINWIFVWQNEPRYELCSRRGLWSVFPNDIVNFGANLRSNYSIWFVVMYDSWRYKDDIYRFLSVSICISIWSIVLQYAVMGCVTWEFCIFDGNTETGISLPRTKSKMGMKSEQVVERPVSNHLFFVCFSR